MSSTGADVGAGTLWDAILKKVMSDEWTGGHDPDAHPLKDDPAAVFAFLGMSPDPWQRKLLESTSRQLLVCCSRQSGKSQTAAAKALHTALVEAPADVLIVSRAQRQSAELMRKVKELYAAMRGEAVRRRDRPWKPKSLGREVRAYAKDVKEGYLPDERESSTARDSVLSMELKNGSRIICLPGTAETIVGYSAINLLIIDEAAKTKDEMYAMLRPVLAVSKGQLLVLSTPFGKRGWFWEEWKHCEELERAGRETRWERVRVTAAECSRIDPEWLGQERASIGNRWAAQEYDCNPPDAPVWMGDYSFRPLGDVRVGDLVIGWKKFEPNQGGWNHDGATSYGKRYLCRSQVLATRERVADLVEVTTESGRVLQCTPTHKWLKWCSTGSRFYQPARVGAYLSRIIDPPKPLPEELRWDAAWLGGIYDGEGSYDTIAQCSKHNPETYKRIETVLRSLGMKVSTVGGGFYFTGHGKNSKKQAMVNFINWCKPTVVKKGLDRIILSANFQQRDRVVAIRPAGRGKVVSMQTTTGNYVVWGYASKNCEFVDTVDMVFSYDDIHAMVSDQVEPLW